MKIDELIAQLEASAAVEWTCEHITTAQTCRKAAETIRLLWEIAQDNSNSKYRRQIGEMRGDDAKVG